MKEERIKFYRPQRIALIGVSPMPSTPDDNKRIELFDPCEGWIVATNPTGTSIPMLIEKILSVSSQPNRCHPIVMKDLGDNAIEVELIVRYKEEKDG